MIKQSIIVAMPCLNEARRVVPAINSLMASSLNSDVTFLLIDGGSTDGTQSLVKETFGDRVEIIHNERKLQAHAMNIAAQIAHERDITFILRADLHAIYPKNFCFELLETIQETGADSVVVPMRTIGGNDIQIAAALLYSSWLGNGNSPHRMGNFRGWIEHGHHALFRVNAFAQIGGYDPEFAANEDAEFDARLLAGGGKIFMENKTSVDYIPRDSLKSTWRQFFRNGRYRIWTAVKHQKSLGKRQLLPIMLLPTLTIATCFALLNPATLLLPMTYIFLLIVMVLLAHKSGPVWPRVPLAISLAIVSHISFSAGAIYGLLELFLLRRETRISLQSRVHTDLRFQ